MTFFTSLTSLTSLTTVGLLSVSSFLDSFSPDYNIIYNKNVYTSTFSECTTDYVNQGDTLVLICNTFLREELDSANGYSTTTYTSDEAVARASFQMPLPGNTMYSLGNTSGIELTTIGKELDRTEQIPSYLILSTLLDDVMRFGRDEISRSNVPQDVCLIMSPKNNEDFNLLNRFIEWDSTSLGGIIQEDSSPYRGDLFIGDCPNEVFYME